MSLSAKGVDRSFNSHISYVRNSQPPAAAVSWGEIQRMVNWIPAFSRWMFPKIGVPQNGWFILENLIKMDALGAPLFLETTPRFLPAQWYLYLHEG